MPTEVAAIGIALYTLGFGVIEGPLNLPDACDSIVTLCRALPTDALIEAAKQQGMVSVTSTIIATEKFTAHLDGADAIKLYPVQMISQKVVCALGAVLPSDVTLFFVGGIGLDNMCD